MCVCVLCVCVLRLTLQLHVCIRCDMQAEKSSVKIQELKDEMARLRGLAGDRERLRMTVQSLEDRLKERETQVR